MMFRTWHLVVFLIAVVAFAVGLAPARSFLPEVEGQLTYSRIDGSIWNARLHDARIGRLDAGDVGVKVSLADIALGRIVADTVLQGAELEGRVRLAVSLGGDIEIRAPALSISGASLPGFGRLLGKTQVSDLVIHFAGRTCSSAEGRLLSDAFVQAFTDPELGPGPQLSGGAGCLGNVARLSMTGEQGDDALRVWLDLDGDGTGRWRISVTTQTAMRAAALAGAGLAPDGKPGSFGSEGEFSWLTF